MIRRLLTALRHLRAGHRIGCVPCNRWDAAVTAIEFASRRYDLDGKRIVDEPMAALVAALRAIAHDREPAAAPAPPRETDTRVPAAGSRTPLVVKFDRPLTPDEAVRARRAADEWLIAHPDEPAGHRIGRSAPHSAPERQEVVSSRPPHEHEWWGGSRGQFDPPQCLICNESRSPDIEPRPDPWQDERTGG